MKTLRIFFGVIALTIVIPLAFGITSCDSGSLTDDDVDIEVETIAGDGTAGNADGPGDEAQFNEPDGVTLSDDGTAYITDMGNHDIKQIDEDGTTTTIAGTSEQGYVDGPADQAQFNRPDGIVTADDGTVYVGDQGNNVIRKITPEGVVSTFAGTGEAGSENGASDEAQFDAPAGVTLDSAGNLYVADEGNNMIRKITPEGEVSTVAGTVEAGLQDGAGDEAQFNRPHGITIDAEDNIFVTDMDNNAVRQVSPEGEVTTIVGDGEAGYSDGPAEYAKLNTPHGIGVSSDGEVFVADEDNNVVREVDPLGFVSTYAGDGEAGFADGNGRRAKFKKPRGLALGRNKDVFICDYSNNRVRKVSQRNR